MITHGLYKTFDLYSNEISLFYDCIDKYFKGIILRNLSQIPLDSHESKRILGTLKSIINDALTQFGFSAEEIESHLTFLWKTEVITDILAETDIFQMYEKLSPLLYKLFLERIMNYVVDSNSNSIMVKLKSEQFLPIEFLINIQRIKDRFNRSSEKKERLKKYLGIQKKILRKLRDSEASIRNLQNLAEPREKLQLSYIIYRIIDFFNLKNLFDFSTIKEYIANKYDDWLDTIPLVSLKNPDLYYCGMYLANQLSIPIDLDKIKYFLLNIYDENIDEFEAPLIEATNQVYYFFKTAWMADLELSPRQITELLKGEEKFFGHTYLKNLETSQLVIILMIYNQLGLYDKIEEEKLRNIINEIEKRIAPEGIKQFRDGFISAEATYFVLYCKYFRDDLKKVNTGEIIDRLISRIFRNLQLIDFSKDINYDLLTELYYACESLQLLSCMGVENMIKNLARHLFPDNIIDELLSNGRIRNRNSRLCDLKVDRLTGELIYLY
ncbi:MAG: hypothetical protein BAJALOKI1v1_50025 [Promethearchaeota archaeon]|nr:MAG: hypothetical protein BAJALOKI1v1_50025 [Candidatus Lokiarchaeota archaeon]